MANRLATHILHIADQALLKNSIIRTAETIIIM
jgi:hypothetical protein